MNNRGSSSHGGNVGGLRRHGVEHLPVQVKLVVFAMVLGLCVVLVPSGGGGGEGGGPSPTRRVELT